MVDSHPETRAQINKNAQLPQGGSTCREPAYVENAYNIPIENVNPSTWQ
jgi:hypothetical protein